MLEFGQDISGWWEWGRLVQWAQLVFRAEAWEMVPGDHVFQEEIGKVRLVDHGVRHSMPRIALTLGMMAKTL